ncbi:DUF7351 domain-containing protein [Halolamina rubra]|uniref:DUF7351 domain-containing protein n=1 Tax=Halolamina rubra TaxID=1380430 RepID=UPI000678A0F9|nr:helix-turn-helix transcriptional regulator [Halolamina rubra]
MTDSDALDDDAGLDPAAAFSLLGEATRLEIVTALNGLRAGTSMAFSDLYDQVDVADSAQFNYHLDRLVPHFVEKGEGGYALTQRGSRIARAVTAGSYTESPAREPFETAGECYACGEAGLVARYEDEQFVVDCPDCGEVVLRLGVPPTVVRDRDGVDLVRAVDRWARAGVSQATDGVCPSCGGRMNAALSEDAPESGTFDVVGRFECGVCGRSAVVGVTTVASQHPVVRTFHRRRGAPIDDRPYWEYSQHVAHEHVDVASGDRVRVSFFEDGDACHATLDDDLDVVEVEVVPGGAPAEQ